MRPRWIALTNTDGDAPHHGADGTPLYVRADLVATILPATAL
jgi:hypothetical protein